MKSMRAKFQLCTFLRLRFFRIHWYCSFASLYSVVRRAWVIPSSESTIGQAKSYVGYIFQVLPVRW